MVYCWRFYYKNPFQYPKTNKLLNSSMKANTGETPPMTSWLTDRMTAWLHWSKAMLAWMDEWWWCSFYGQFIWWPVIHEHNKHSTHTDGVPVQHHLHRTVNQSGSETATFTHIRYAVDNDAPMVFNGWMINIFNGLINFFIVLVIW